MCMCELHVRIIRRLTQTAGDSVTLRLSEVGGTPPPAIPDAPSVFAPALALPLQESSAFRAKNQNGPIVDAYVVLQCSRAHDVVLLLFQLMQRIATNQLVRAPRCCWNWR